jgi:hypothetical protein
MDFARQSPKPLIWALAEIDSDENRSTGVIDSPSDDCSPFGLGVDQEARVFHSDAGLLANIRNEPSGSGLSGPENAYFLYDGASATLMLPLSRVGGDTSLRFGSAVLVSFGGNSASFSDCAPNGGNITCQNGACAFVPFRNGDANCVTGANAIDAAIVLQYAAGLLSTLTCPDAADVDGNSVIDSRDAALILQFAAGLIDQLPPIPCRAPPEFC